MWLGWRFRGFLIIPIFWLRPSSPGALATPKTPAASGCFKVSMDWFKGKSAGKPQILWGKSMVSG